MTEFSQPGGLVLDPMCGIGTSLMEGALTGRRCIGLDREPDWVTQTRANLDHTPAAARNVIAVECWDARLLDTALGLLHGQIDLVILHPPAARGIGAVDTSSWRPTPWQERASLTSRPAAPSLNHQQGRRYLQSLADILGLAADSLREGGHLVLVSRPGHTAGRLNDLAATSVTLANAAGTGLAYRQHIVALRAAIRDGALVPRSNPWQRRVTHQGGSAVGGRHLVVHDNLTVFVKPATSASPADPLPQAQRPDHSGPSDGVGDDA